MEQPPAPSGLAYQPEFNTQAEERQVLEAMELHAVTMHGRPSRRTVHH